MSASGEFIITAAETAGLDPSDPHVIDRITHAMDASCATSYADMLDDVVAALTDDDGSATLRLMRDVAGLGAFCLLVYALVYAVGTVMVP